MPPDFAIVRRDVAVRLATGETASHVVYQSFSDVPNVLFLSAEDLKLLQHVVDMVGGTQRGAPTQVMQTPNQPVGHSREIVGF